jgi:hypothetical protein
METETMFKIGHREKVFGVYRMTREEAEAQAEIMKKDVHITAVYSVMYQGIELYAGIKNRDFAEAAAKRVEFYVHPAQLIKN